MASMGKTHPSSPKAREKQGKHPEKTRICLPGPNPSNSWGNPCSTRILECSRSASREFQPGKFLHSLLFFSRFFLTFCAWAGSVRTRVKSPRQISSCWGVPLQIWEGKSKLQVNSRWDWRGRKQIPPLKKPPGSSGNLRHPGAPGVWFRWKKDPRRHPGILLMGMNTPGIIIWE